MRSTVISPGPQDAMTVTPLPYREIALLRFNDCGLAIDLENRIIRVIDRFLQEFAPQQNITAKDLGTAGDPVSTLAGVVETYGVTARYLSDLC